MLPETFLACLICFQDCFTAPSFQSFLALLTGWVLCTSKHTVTGVMRAAGVVGKRDFSGYHYFFNTAAWSADDVGIALMTLLLGLSPAGVRVRPGHKKDDVLVATDLSMSAEEVIAEYCARWSLEETIGWAKSRLGFEDLQNRKEKAVERTAPMALWTYSLVVYWYACWSRRRRHLSFRFGSLE